MFSPVSYFIKQYPWLFTDSVIDVGCGTSFFTRDYLATKAGQCSNIVLLDGDRAALDASLNSFRRFTPNFSTTEVLQCDLSDANTVISVLGRIRRDRPGLVGTNNFFGPTVICTEVLEHIKFTSEDSGKFISALCMFNGPVIFSCAYPNQPGDGHVNCMYPSEVARKFFDMNYVCLDFRKYWWHLLREYPAIPFWTVQNTLLFVPRLTFNFFRDKFMEPAGERKESPAVYTHGGEALDVIHPIFMEAGIKNGWFNNTATK